MDVRLKSKTSNSVFLLSFHFYSSLHSFLSLSLFSLSFLYLQKFSFLFTPHLLFCVCSFPILSTLYPYHTCSSFNFYFIFFFPFCLFAFFWRIGNESPGNVNDEAQWCFDIRWLQFRTKTFLNCPTVDSSECNL